MKPCDLAGISIGKFGEYFFSKNHIRTEVVAFTRFTDRPDNWTRLHGARVVHLHIQV